MKRRRYKREEAPSLRARLSVSKKSRQFSLPLTPLIDVTFLLLLYFLLTSTFREPEQQLMTHIPSPAGKQSILLPVHITVEPAGDSHQGVQYQFDRERVTDEISVVRDFLAARIKVGNSEVPVIIHASPHVRWHHVIVVFNAASATGFKAVTFAPLKVEITE